MIFTIYAQRTAHLHHQTARLVKELKRIEEVEATGDKNPFLGQGYSSLVLTTAATSPPQLIAQYNNSSTPASDTSEYNNELINAISNELRDLDRSFSSPGLVLSDVEEEPESEYIITEIYNIYRKHNPAKLATVAELLQKYKGREEVKTYQLTETLIMLTIFLLFYTAGNTYSVEEEIYYVDIEPFKFSNLRI